MIYPFYVRHPENRNLIQAIFVACEAETLSMEASTPLATPSLTAPLCGQDLETPISVRARSPLLINIPRANEEHAQV